MKYSGICLITKSVPTLVRFYSTLFACEAVGDDIHAEFCFGGLNLAIFSIAGMEEMAPGSMKDAGYGSFTIGFAVDNVDAEYARLKALGVEFVKPPQTHPWGARSLWFRDPDGNIIDFFTPVPA
jgi:catechol 2,3-dioxygenase-like lactoylglutathione lyase family enzyme